MSTLRIAVRSLLRQPVFTAVVVLSLAIGIALDTTMYGVLDALMRPRIDMRNPERLYSIRLYGLRRGNVDNRISDAALMSGLHTYESATRSDGQRTALIEFGQGMLQVAVGQVAPNFFDVTGARVLAGRTFAPFDETAELKPIVVTDQLVKLLFQEGQLPVGARVTLEGRAMVIIGVVSQATNFPRERVSAWEISNPNPKATFIRLIRLRENATQADAERELGIISARLAAEAGIDAKEVAFRFRQASNPGYQVEDFQLALILAVTAVLLVACVNVANIQLARGIGRRREIALRSALGASRQRIVLNLLTESGLLVALGLVLGLVGTYWGSKLLVASIPPTVGEYIVEPQFSWRVLVFSLVATTFCLILVGLLPAASVSRTDPNELLKSGAGTGAHKRNRRFYAILVCAEIGLALVLSCGAAAVVRSWAEATTTAYAFDTDSLSQGFLSLNISANKYQYSQILQTVVERLEGLREFGDVAASLGMRYDRHMVTVDDGVRPREFLTYGPTITVVSYNFLRAFGLRVLDGRDFVAGDGPAVIVDQKTARYLWGSKSPVGSLVKFGDVRSTRPYVRVIGVASNLVLPIAANEAFYTPRGVGNVYYVPGPYDSTVSSNSTVESQKMAVVDLVVRSKIRPEGMPLLVRQAVAGWPDARMRRIETWDNYYGSGQRKESTRFVASLFTLFAVVGVGLAAFGVYGVVAHSVAERRRELGVRLALGASARDILHTILRESVVVALAGTAIGLLMTKFGVILLRRVAGGEIYNAVLFAVVALLLAGVIATAAFVPALRATRIDPTESLRNE